MWKKFKHLMKNICNSVPVEFHDIDEEVTVAIVHITEYNLESISQFRRENIERLGFRDRFTYLIIDLREITSITAIGIGYLIIARQQIQAAGKDMILVVHPNIMERMHILHGDSVMKLFTALTSMPDAILYIEQELRRKK